MRRIVYFFLLSILIHGIAEGRVSNLNARQGEPTSTMYDSLKEVLFDLETQFMVYFNYDDDLLRDVHVNEEVKLPTSINELDKFLETLFEKHGLTFEKLKDDTYVIKKENQNTGQSSLDQSTYKTASLGSRSYMNRNGNSGPHFLEGRVLDEKNEGLPGATILIKNSDKGTVSDVSGNFILEIPENLMPAVLVISFVGYETKELLITSQSTIDIALELDIATLEEVVVVGYGVQKRSNLTGSISSVKVDDLENRPIIRLDQALQGMSSGVFVSKGGGAPGASPSIHIRGVGSLNGTEPLWVVDGIKMQPGNHFNLDDVESIEVLKDAASSAVYGAEAAHGVILVTTKRGKEGKTQINYRSSFAKVNPIQLPELLGSEDFVYYKRISRLNAGQNPEPSWDNWEHDTDWVDAYYSGSGFSHYHDFSIAKGTDRSSYYFSVGYDDETGILIDNDFQRFSLRFNSDFELAKWLKVGESILLSRVSENPIDNFNEDYNGSIPYRSLPIMPIYDDSNPFGGWGMAPVYFQGPNPVATQYQQQEKRHYNRLDGNIYLQATPVEGLMVRARVGYNYMSFLGKAFDEAFDYGSFANPINSLTYADGNNETITGNFVGTYEKGIGKSNFKLMVGYEASKFNSINYNITATNFLVDGAESFNLAGGTFNVTNRYTVDTSPLLSQFGRFNYNFNEKYLFEANVRRDASGAKFGDENVWGVFPSFSLGWRLSEETFIQNIPIISNLKLRLSTGKLGSDNIRSFIFDKTYTSQFSTYAFDENGNNKVVGYYLSKFPNANVQWEEVKMNNIGLDVAVFDDKISFSADYYIKNTEKFLYPVAIPSSVGIATHNFDPVNPEENIGTMRNTGLDLDLSYRESYGRFNLRVNANSSFMKNEVLGLVDGGYITAGNGGGQIGGMTRTEAGYPISSFYGFVVQQMLNSESDVFAVNSYAADGTYQEAGTGPGDFMYRDISGPEGVPDGEITWEHDRVYIGNPWPKMMYGLNINLDYNKVIDIMLQFQGVQGVDIFNANLAYSRNFFGDYNTTSAIFDAWTPENNTMHPRNIASDPNQNFSRPSTYFVEDGSYLKLRNLQIGYNIPEQILAKLGGINKIRLFANANNLLTITSYSGADPEIAGSNVGRGVDYGLYPHTRTFGGGIDVQF